MNALQYVEIRHAHFFCGLGGGAKGFNRGQARVGNMVAKFRCIGGIDVDPGAIADFSRAAGVPGTVLDLFSREQYTAFHGREPGSSWKEASIDQVRGAFGNERPHIVFLSAPCKGFSGLLAEKASQTAKYQALNGLTLRGVFLMCEAWKDDPPELIVFENVPRIQTRGRRLLDQISALLRSYGYAVAETTHDCGELGGLAQSRKRFLLVARHAAKVPPFLYEPPKRRLLGVGEILDKLPLPGSGLGGAMHRMPALQWKTWVRLAFVEAGSDWRSLNRLRVENGMLKDFGIVPDVDYNSGVLGVRKWDEPTGVVPGRSYPLCGSHSVADPRPDNFKDRALYGVTDWEQPSSVITSQRSPGQGRFAVSDPRVDGHPKSVQIGVRRWDEPAGVVTGKMFVGGGPNSVADPRSDGERPRFNNVFRVVRLDDPSPASGAVIGASSTGNGAFAVADCRLDWNPGAHTNKMKVIEWEKPSGAVTKGGHGQVQGGALSVADPRPEFGPATHHNVMQVHGWEDHAKVITASTHPAGGALSVADPRPNCIKGKGDDYQNGGHYGVVPWDGTSGAVAAAGQHDNGRWSVADPRDQEAEPIPALPQGTDRLIAVIRALDGTWHRPFTTLELAALQSLVDPEEHLELEGLSDSAWRERIGNAVPPEAARAIAGVMGETLLLAWSGETFVLSSTPIWVQPLAIALSVDSSKNYALDADLC